MKRIVASVGLVAVGASGLQAGLLPSMTAESGKPWTLSATLRGFYDDNFNTLPNNVALPAGQHRAAFGFEVSPGLEFSLPMEQTSLSFGYVYSLKYYQYKPYLSTDYYDQTHNFHVGLTHAFSERYSVNVRDSLVIGQEPDMLRAGSTYSTFQRISGSNLRNYGSIDFMAQMTPEFGITVGYANTLYSYADNLFIDTPAAFPNPRTISPSSSGLMDELEHVAHIDGRYQLQPQTIGIVGLQFRENDYTGNQPIYFNPTPPGTIQYSDSRNARSYYGYVGVDHNFRPDLTGSIRGGAYWTDYYNDPTSQNQASPYAMASLQYTYLPESYFQFGGSYDYSASSAFNPNPANGSLTLNAQSATVYANLKHRITPKLFGSILAQFQNSTYYGGLINNRTDRYYVLGLNLQYRFTPNFSAEIGYNYDKLDSEVNYFGATVAAAGVGSFDRNRFYLGVTGSY